MPIGLTGVSDEAINDDFCAPVMEIGNRFHFDQSTKSFGVINNWTGQKYARRREPNRWMPARQHVIVEGIVDTNGNYVGGSPSPEIG